MYASELTYTSFGTGKDYSTSGCVVSKVVNNVHQERWNGGRLFEFLDVQITTVILKLIKLHIDTRDSG